jgi:hypothetical protein
MAITEDSADAGTPAVAGINTAANGIGVEGTCETGSGVRGRSKSGRGVQAESQTGYGLRASSETSAAVRATSAGGRGVEGHSTTKEGVVGQSDGELAGVMGISNNGPGVVARSEADYGLRASSATSAAVRATSVGGRGVEGHSTNKEGVVGQSDGAAAGVRGISQSGKGVHGTSDNEVGVFGASINSEGVHAETTSLTTAAIAAYNENHAAQGPSVYAVQRGGGSAVHAVVLNPNGVGPAVHADNQGNGVGIFAKGRRLAGLFEGIVEVTGDIRLVNAADCAENFDVSGVEGIEPGTVMVLGDDGVLQASHRAYDKKVAGVVSGAGDFRPGIVLDRHASDGTRQPIALLGKVFCKADASVTAIEAGDLLTTSALPGHAMKASDPFKAFGAVIGKALRPLKDGRGLIPILVALQ